MTKTEAQATSHVEPDMSDNTRPKHQDFKTYSKQKTTFSSIAMNIVNIKFTTNTENWMYIKSRKITLAF